MSEHNAEIKEPDIRELVLLLRAADEKQTPQMMTRLCSRAAEQISWLYRLYAAYRDGADFPRQREIGESR